MTGSTAHNTHNFSSFASNPGQTTNTGHHLHDYYQRQIRLPQIGPQGQECLSQARVLVIGLGALGCPAAEYLARAGVGELFLMDGDSIAIHNLHRQPLYTPTQAGVSKAEAAAARLSESNPLIQVHPIHRFFSNQGISAGSGNRPADHRASDIPVLSGGSELAGGTELDTPPAPGLNHQQKTRGNWQNSPGKEPADKAWAGARASGLAASGSGSELAEEGGASWELRLVEGMDLVLDCTDRFSSRFAIHDACQGAGVRLVSAAVTGFTGQLQVYHFDSSAGPCLRCLYPRGLIDGCTGSCAQDGILGAAAGIMGSLQALTSLQFLLGLDVPGMGVTTTLNLQTMERHTMQWPQAPDCPGCGTHHARSDEKSGATAPSVPGNTGPGSTETPMSSRSVRIPQNKISPAGDNARLSKTEPPPSSHSVKIPQNPIVIDLREPEEIQPEDGWFFPGALNIPTSRITEELGRMDRGQAYLLVCEHGQRSQSVLGYLKGQGFRQVSHFEQGFAGLRAKIRQGG
jgi:adenylyltransferase/sulfurtransferase